MMSSLYEYLPAQKIDKCLLEPFNYLVKNPGKSLRYKIVEAFQEWIHAPEEYVQIIMRVLEMFHIAGLMIDDVEDCSDLRHGVPAAHKIYGVAPTINTANYVCFLAMKEALKLGKQLQNPGVAEYVTEELINLHRGQGMDLYWRESAVCPTEEEFLEMISNKTGGEFRLLVRLLQVASDNTMDFMPFITAFSIYFQIRDDYLNLCSKEMTKNKGWCEDLSEGKFSFPVIHSIHSNPENCQLLNIIKTRPKEIEVKKYALALMEKTGSFEYCRRYLERLEMQLYKMISCLGDNAKWVGILSILAKEWKT